MSWLSANELAQMRADVANLLPDTCTILSVAYTSDSEGGLTEAWGTATASVACRLDFIAGREMEAGGAIQPYTKVMLSLPYSATLATDNRVKVGSETYAVKSVNNGQSWNVAIRAELERL